MASTKSTTSEDAPAVDPIVDDVATEDSIIEPDFERPFIRVKDKQTGHQYDVHMQAFDPEVHERLERFEPAAMGRPAKLNVLRDAGTTETSVDPTDQGVSPDTASAS